MYSGMYNSLAKIFQVPFLMTNVFGDQKPQKSTPKFTAPLQNITTPITIGDSDKSLRAKDRYVLEMKGYLVGRQIDSGAFATVYYAEKKTSIGAIPLAVKIIDIFKVESSCLLNEMQIWPRLRYPHIVQVDQMIQIRDRVYIFMELAPRGSVFDYVEKYGAATEDVGRMWCKKMCQALRYCHMQGVAHRDVKCDNLLLDKDLQLKIGDFGFCCRSVDPKTGNSTLSDTYCGSSHYIAPEILENRPYHPICADVWSAGVCMYVILNGCMPFDDSNLARMHLNQITGNWYFTDSADEKLSDSAKDIIEHMLEPDPTRRPSMDKVLKCSWLSQS